MAGHQQVKAARADIDIQEDVNAAFLTYPPLSHDRKRIHVNIDAGIVTASGNVKTGQAREIFAREVSKIEGVHAVNTAALYDDESIRLQVGGIVPYGVLTAVSYGAVVLSGKAPAEPELKRLVDKVSKIEGVRTVIPNFK